MRNKPKPQILLADRTKFTGLFLFFLILSLVSVESAFSIDFTNVKHLFDIKKNFNQPSDVSVSPKGFIYVVDGVNNKIKAFDSKGSYLFSFGQKGTGKGSFNYPLGIDIDSSGKVYIADSGNHRIQIFTPRGDFISQIKISEELNPADPTDVAVDESRNRCYVVDNDNHNILVYDLATHKLIATYGEPGTERREFRYPFLMALDKDNYLFIVEVINTRIQVLNPDGLFVTYIGKWGVEKGEFYRPKGIAIDRDNRIYVSDSYVGVIQVFTKKDEFHSVISDQNKNAVKKFKSPVGIYIDDKNRLYVVEMFSNKVSVYSIEGVTKSDTRNTSGVNTGGDTN